LFVAKKVLVRGKNMEMPIESLNKQKTPEKEKGFTRVQCKACFRVRLMRHGGWEVSIFEEKHNHPLISSPSKKRNLRSHKGINEGQVDTIQNLSAQNVGTSQILE
jgi:FAR1 DNA-binding domain